MKLLYPRSLELDPGLLEGFSVSLHSYDVEEMISQDLIDAEVLVTWSNSSANLIDAARRMHNLKWIQSLAAGPNDVLAAGFDTTKITLTTGSGLHDRTVAEHTLGLLLCACRRFHEMRDQQLQCEWPGHLGGPQPDRPSGKLTTLRNANVLIWGYGNIAKALTPSLLNLGAVVRGVSRHPGVSNGIEVFVEADLPKLLPQTDALVMILPGSEKTKNALGEDRIARLPNHAWVVNVGRGSCVDEDALVSAVESRRIGGAALDVFHTEPLPRTSGLWKQKNVIISPHAAGGRPQGSEELIAANLRRFLANQPLRNVL